MQNEAEINILNKDEIVSTVNIMFSQNVPI